MPKESDTTSLTEPLRIFLVEDNEHDRIAFVRTLARAHEDFTVRIEETGEAAVKALASDPECADVVVVDYNLPGITGISVLEALKSLVGPGRLPPFVLLTANVSEHLASAAIKAGMYDFVLKDMEDRYLSRLPKVLISAYRRHRDCLAHGTLVPTGVCPTDADRG